MHRRMRIVKESNEVRCNGRRVGVAMVDSSVKDCTQTLLWLKEKPSGIETRIVLTSFEQEFDKKAVCTLIGIGKVQSRHEI